MAQTKVLVALTATDSAVVARGMPVHVTIGEVTVELRLTQRPWSAKPTYDSRLVRVVLGEG